MSISLKKNQSIVLKKSINKFSINLGWQTKVDVDASLFVLNNACKVRKETDLVFYGNKIWNGGKIKHLGDSRKGSEGGKNAICETILLDTTDCPEDVDAFAIVITIHEHDAKNLNFGKVKNCFVTLVDEDKKEELLRYELSEENPEATSFIFATIHRNSTNSEIWEFVANGDSEKGGLAELCAKYGIQVAD